MKSKKEQILLQLQKRFHRVNFKLTFLLYPYLDKPDYVRFTQVGTDFIWLRPLFSPKGIYSKQLAVPNLNLGVICTWAWLSEASQPKLIKNLLVKGLIECLPTLIPPTSISLLRAYRIYLVIPLGLPSCVEISWLLWKHILRMHILQMHLMLWHVEPWILPGMSNFWLTLGSKKKEQFYNVGAFTFTRLDNDLAITLYPKLSKANCFTPLEVTIEIRIVPKDPPLAAYHKYKPQKKKNSARLCMLHIHLKQLKKLLRNIKSLLPQSAKVDYTQEDLVKKISHFINIWCYLQIIFSFSHTLKQPMMVRTYSKVGFGTSNSPTSTKSFVTGVKKFSCYPPGVKGLKVEILVLFLPQLKRGYLKGGLFQLKKKISEASLRGPLLTYTNNPLSRVQRIKPKMLLALAMYFNHRYLLPALIVCRQPLLSNQTNPLLSLRGLLQRGMLLTSIWVRHTSSLFFLILIWVRQFVFYYFGTSPLMACSEIIKNEYNNELPGLTVFAYSRYKSYRLASFTLGMAENQLKKKLGTMGISGIFIRAKLLEVQLHTYTTNHIKIKEVCIKKNKEITPTNPSFEQIDSAKQNLFVERDIEAKTPCSPPPVGGYPRGIIEVKSLYHTFIA